MSKKYRKLTEKEILQLEKAGCFADKWSEVEVSKRFSAENIKNVRFGGVVKLGDNGNHCAPVAGCNRKSGIYNATIYDCTVGDGVFISNVGRYLAGYDIDDEVVIENVGEISSQAGDTFGYGVEAAVINEAGGREIPLFGELNAQMAYIIAMYRHRSETIAKIKELIDREVKRQSQSRARIGRASKIVNTNVLKGVSVGAGAEIFGALQLTNGTVDSSLESPTYVGSNVLATDFILAKSAKVDTGALLNRVFVGEGVIIERGFSAENSVFFANSHCAHGEACSVFGGPFTVTHHRSTLLIAGYFSFFNAGSGANQSNHMYKEGPVHQGVHLRGCKFGSDAYVLLPARTGAFTVVKGRHVNHHDTEDMPFSYLIEEAGSSFLIPAIGLRSYGIARDIKKWPNRDKRSGAKGDIINYSMINPYLGDKIIRAIEQSEEMLQRRSTAEFQTWNRVKISTLHLKKGVQLYGQAIRGYLSGILDGVDLGQIRDQELFSDWVDMAGMIAPKARVDLLLSRVDSGEIDSIEEIKQGLEAINSQFEQDARVWAIGAVSMLLGRELADLTQEEVGELIEQGKEDQRAINSLIATDASKDFAPLMSVGYGIDSEQDREQDFRTVRGLED